jgi:hypothetical protein
MGSAPRHQLGVAGSINALFRNIGTVSGTSLSVLLFMLVTQSAAALSENQTFDDAVFLHGFGIVLKCAAVLYLIALPVSIIVKPKSQT